MSRAARLGIVLLGAALLAGAWWLARRSRAGEPLAPATPAAAPSASPAPEDVAAANPEPSAAPEPSAGAAAEFLDEASCAGCHAHEVELWRGSDHDLAMQEATSETVLGAFDDARFESGPSAARFFRDAQGFAVETEGADGKRSTFPVPYVFGVRPLQQLLLPLARGRLQALSIAWDVKQERWFTLYPGEHIDARDVLHWTKAAQNWNFSCAECHATNLVRGYDAASDTYHTTWSRLDVGCQACHGPGSRHLRWAIGGADDDVRGRGFDASLVGAEAEQEIEACARCHARRAPLGDGFDHRHRLMDDYLPALLGAGLYFADGQIQDEVYEYGSFEQSKMHARGVRCSDCHEPHSLALRRPGNELCSTCHSPTPAAPPRVDVSQLQRRNYDTPEHHHHAPGQPGSFCVDCHMPQRTYMVVDPRRDHGFRVPRPDLAEATGAPDICAACHAQRGASWAAQTIAGWSGPVKRQPTFGVALAAARRGANGAADGLLALLASDAAPIVRATALTELVRYPGERALSAFVAGLADGDGLVRHAALGGIEELAPEERAGLIGSLLADPLRAVRAEAARQLSSLSDEALGPFAAAEKSALAEYEAIQRSLLERPEARLNLAQLLAERGKSAEAEGELRSALRLEPAFVPGYVNLAEIARGTKGEGAAEAVLREGLQVVPDAAALHHALGLMLVRAKRTAEALGELARAAALAPEEPRFGYVHAVALHDTGKAGEARAVLEQVLALHPAERDARFALSGYLEEAGDRAGAQRCLAELAAINPHDPGLAGALDPAVAPQAPKR